MNNTDDNKNNDNYKTAHLSRKVLIISLILSLVVFTVLSLKYYDTDFSPFLMWFIAVLAGGISLLNAFLRKERSDLNRLLLPWFVLGIIFLIYNTQVQHIKEDLTNAKITAAGYRDAVERDVKLPFKGGQPWLVHQFLLAMPGVERVRILGINALSVLHVHRSNLMRIIDKDKGLVQILLLKGALPEQDASQAFQARVAEEEGGIDGRKGWIANRLQKEWEASIAILADMLNQLLGTHRIKWLNQRFEIRFHEKRPDRSMLFVEKQEADKETGESIHRKYLLLNHYSKNSKEPGQKSLSLLVDDSWIEYTDEEEVFERLWANAEEFPLEKLEKMLDKLSVDAQEIKEFKPESTEQLYERALQYHKERCLDEASYLYQEVLEGHKWKSPSPEQKQLAERFLPRVFTTEKEEFELKDLVVVLHPTERLIGYHLVWEDDIDFLIDNDPGDHEIVWIQYDEAQERVEQVWAYWHKKFLQTKEAVEDANNNNSRVAIYVQWGKHGSLLKGWEKKIKIDGDKNVEEFEPLQYSRLRKGRYSANGFYAEQYRSFFDGTEGEFKSFPKEVNLQERLREKQMIVVSKYANAVIDQWFLPYNIYPKPDWPRD